MEMIYLYKLKTSDLCLLLIVFLQL